MVRASSPPTQDLAKDAGEGKAARPDLGYGELALLLGLGERLVSELDVGNVLALVAETARQVVQAETLAVPMIDPDRQTFTYRAADGEHAAALLGTTFPIREGNCGWVIEHQRPLLFGRGGRFDLDAAKRWEPGMASALLVPLVCRGSIIGGLSAMGKRGGGAFDLRDLKVLTLFANQASIAIENARLFQKLSDEQLRLRLVLDSAGEAIYGVDNSGLCTFANPACVRMLGYAGEADLIGRHMHSTIHHTYPDGRPYPAEECRVRFSTREGRAVHADDEVHWRADGTSFPVEYWSHPIYRDGRIEGAVVAFIDITERKRQEETLRGLNETLEQRVRDETARNMAQERLLIQQSRLAAMGEMIHNIAHQWRQPITTLTLVLANIKDAYEFDELTPEYLNATVRKGQQMIQGMSATIDDFRNFFKPNKEKEHFLACDAAAEAIKFITDSFIANNIKVIQEKGLEPCSVFGYPNEFAQVVLNALTNAKEAIAERQVAGEVRVTVGKTGNSAVVSIRDNGGGIPEGILGKVFDPYFSTKESGSGIGLYMSKMIMDNMGGDIRIANVEGGAEVSITMPLAEPAGSPVAGGA